MAASIPSIHLRTRLGSQVTSITHVTELVLFTLSELFAHAYEFPAPPSNLPSTSSPTSPNGSKIGPLGYCTPDRKHSLR
jgi:hypothetical protein